VIADHLRQLSYPHLNHHRTRGTSPSTLFTLSFQQRIPTHLTEHRETTQKAWEIFHFFWRPIDCDLRKAKLMMMLRYQIALAGTRELTSYDIENFLTKTNPPYYVDPT
jgi:hypothetical protein